MKLIKGTDLTPKQVQEVYRAYVHRHYAIPSYYPDDRAWLLDHAFYIRKDGHLSNAHHHCEPAYMAD